MASGAHIHWNEGKNKVTLEDQVKDQTLEDMIKRYKLINHAKDCEVSESDIRDKDVSDMIQNYKNFLPPLSSVIQLISQGQPI